VNRTGLTQAVANELRCSKLQADQLVKTVLAQIEIGVREDGKVALVGFGTFRLTKSRARIGRNPHTGTPIQIPDGVRVHFTASKVSPMREVG
jgi:DNA-binding protein HU-beta